MEISAIGRRRDCLQLNGISDGDTYPSHTATAPRHVPFHAAPRLGTDAQNSIIPVAMRGRECDDGDDEDDTSWPPANTEHGNQTGEGKGEPHFFVIVSHPDYVCIVRVLVLY